jgi:PEP-CTERM/exosortase A-associated glycosyltransferase
MRILHVLHTSLPFLCGYSIRSSHILREQKRRGLELLAVTSAQHPNGAAAVETIEGVEHRRTPAYHGSSWAPWRELQLMRRLKRELARAAAEWKPAIIHAHSPVLVGLPALEVANQLGVPFVYEVRDLWENASVDRGRFRHGSPLYRLARAAESYVLRRSDAVVTICEALRSELLTRMSTQARVHVVANGVDVNEFSPRPEVGSLRDRLGLRGKRVLLYAGAFQPYEGLPLLIDAMADLTTRVPQAHLVVVGGRPPQSSPERGSLEDALRKMVLSLGLGGSVSFTGQVPHSNVAGYYSLAEIVVYPRVRTNTTALTTPLKPLEAMASGRAVIVSDLPPMRELVIERVTGLCFPAGDATALADRCHELLKNDHLRASLGASARRFVTSERQWTTLAAGYEEAYRSVSVPS